MYLKSLFVTFFLLSSSLFGFLAQIVLVSIFGVSVEMDIYFSLLSLPSVITGMAPAVFSSVLIPIFARFKGNHLELDQFIKLLWPFVLIFSVIFVLLGVCLSYLYVNFFSLYKIFSLNRTTFNLTLIIWIGGGFSLLSSFLAAILNYRKNFIQVAWTANLPPVVMILMVLIFHKSIGVESIALGFLLAFFLQFIIFLRASAFTLVFKSFKLKQLPHKRILISQSVLVILSLLPFTILSPLGFYWTTHLDHGSASYIGYSQSFAGFLSVASSMGIALVSFPNLADSFAKGEGVSALKDFERALRYIMIIAFFAAGILVTTRVPLLTFVYHRGSFNVGAINQLTKVLPWYLLSAVFISGLNLLRTLFYARGRFKYVALLGLTISLFFFVIAGVLVKKYSFVGIGIAHAISFFILFFTTMYCANEEKMKFLTKDFTFFFMKLSLTNIISGFAANVFFMYLPGELGDLASIVTMSLFFVVFALVLVKYFFRVNEVIEILNKLAQLNLSKNLK